MKLQHANILKNDMTIKSSKAGKIYQNGTGLLCTSLGKVTSIVSLSETNKM